MLDPDDEALAYGKDRETTTSTGKKVVFKEQSSNKIKLEEKIISLEDFEKLFG